MIMETFLLKGLNKLKLFIGFSYLYTHLEAVLLSRKCLYDSLTNLHH